MPIYLDTEIMVPLANYHDIEVMTDVSVSQRDLGERSGRGGASVSVPIPGSPKLELSGGKSSESEVTQERIVKSHPADALNRLIDSLTRENELAVDFVDGARKRQLVELDREWSISPATEVGSILTSLVSSVVNNPTLLQSHEPPTELLTSLIGNQSSEGKVVLDALPNSPEEHRVLVLIESENILGRSSIDDFEDERTVFGQVDTVVGAGASYSLEKFFLSGFNRSVRRSFNIENELEKFSPMVGREITASDLSVPGPLVVVKAIAMY